MYLLKNFILFYYSAELFGASGVSFAINDGTRSVETALRGQGQTVQPGKYLCSRAKGRFENLGVPVVV